MTLPYQNNPKRLNSATRLQRKGSIFVEVITIKQVQELWEIVIVTITDMRRRRLV